VHDLRIAPLVSRHRSRVSELLTSTASFSPEEIDVALELFDEALGEGADSSTRPVGSLGMTSVDIPSAARSAESRNPHLAPDYELIGAFNGDDLLGYACFGPTPSTQGTYDLYWLAVDPAAQGRGVGRALVRWIERELVDRGGRLIVVETSSRTDYAPTRKFYERAGYAEAARVRDFYAPADDRIILTTRLTQTPGGVATQ
jgi:ribosomal protein S18 acetylase RimI-like enzyme